MLLQQACYVSTTHSDAYGTCGTVREASLRSVQRRSEHVMIAQQAPRKYSLL